jgi:hypothetical protein
MKNNNIFEQLEKVIELQEESAGQLIGYIKPKNKNKIKIYDTDYSAIDIINNDNNIFQFKKW